jgi:hypothetical protein
LKYPQERDIAGKKHAGFVEYRTFFSGSISLQEGLF